MSRTSRGHGDMAVVAHDSSSKTSRARRREVVGWAVAALLTAVTVGYAGWFLVIGNNLRVVDPGKYYRSARMDGPDLAHTIGSHGIRRVLNLCGSQKNKTWYDDEIRICAELGVDQDNLRITPGRLPSRKVVRRLIEVFDEGPYPMLVHCGGGADRAGFAAALYQIIVLGHEPAIAAAQQLTWKYGHIPVGGHQNLDRFFELSRDRPSGVDFRTWALTQYDDGRR